MSKAQTISARRRADRARRERQRAKQKRKREQQRAFKFRVKVVRTYRYLKKQMPEKEAIKVVLEKYGPSAAWHFKLSASTVRRWHRLVGPDHNYAALRPKSTRPKTIHYQVPALVEGMIFTLRHQLNWGGHRIAAELAARGIWQLSGQTVYNIFERLGRLPWTVIWFITTIIGGTVVSVGKSRPPDTPVVPFLSLVWLKFPVWKLWRLTLSSALLGPIRLFSLLL